VFASPTPEAAEGKPCLSILDSTDPVQVKLAAEQYPPDKSLYVVSSKSGGTAETRAFLEYFWELSDGDSSCFVAITDPDSPLESLAKARKFRKIFDANASVGGRYSALTAFGLVPAALLGLDVKHLLQNAEHMLEQCAQDVTAARNPGLVLGAVMADSALKGRDKLTILADEPLITFGSWLEQLIAESSGKDGKGIVPVDREPLGDASVYGEDRLFVYLRQTGEHDENAAALRNAGHPVLELPVPETYDLGTEFYRWEFAIAVACHILGVNAFDQPNVEDAKKRAKARITDYQEKGKLEEGEYVPLEEAGSAIADFLTRSQAGDYLALAAFLPRTGEMIEVLQDLRRALRDKTNLAVTLGFGPRFLHSTGQLHKGGANNGLFLQITADPVEVIEIPTQNISFGTLELAQALGDYEALVAKDRRVLRVHLSRPDEVRKLIELFR
jgi:transaldolase/glucose-6-phosphate isomerase